MRTQDAEDRRVRDPVKFDDRTCVSLFRFRARERRAVCRPVRFAIPGSFSLLLRCCSVQLSEERWHLHFLFVVLPCCRPGHVPGPGSA